MHDYNISAPCEFQIHDRSLEFKSLTYTCNYISCHKWINKPKLEQ